MIMSKEEIEKFLPHRPPFLFVDKVVEMEVGKSIVAVKRFSPSEYFFEGHFPGNPIVPGVILVEALAQAGGILAYATDPEGLRGKAVALMGLDGVKFRKPVLPGDEVRLCLEILKRRGRVWKMRGLAFVEEVKAVEAEITASIF